MFLQWEACSWERGMVGSLTLYSDSPSLSTISLRRTRLKTAVLKKANCICTIGILSICYHCCIRNCRDTFLLYSISTKAHMPLSPAFSTLSLGRDEGKVLLYWYCLQLTLVYSRIIRCSELIIFGFDGLNRLESLKVPSQALEIF